MAETETLSGMIMETGQSNKRYRWKYAGFQGSFGWDQSKNQKIFPEKRNHKDLFWTAGGKGTDPVFETETAKWDHGCQLSVYTTHEIQRKQNCLSGGDQCKCLSYGAGILGCCGCCWQRQWGNLWCDPGWIKYISETETDLFSKMDKNKWRKYDLSLCQREAAV